MVFVTLGTQKQQFSRLLENIEDSSILKNEEVIVQIGHTKYTRNRFKTVEFLSKEELQEYVNRSEFVITHGGVGTIMPLLEQNKKVLAVPRIKRNNEHVDDHQVEICKKLSSLGYITMFNPYDDMFGEKDSLDSKINFLRTTNFNKYICDDSMVYKLKQVIDEI